jgi:hypothetical protein
MFGYTSGSSVSTQWGIGTLQYPFLASPILAGDKCRFEKVYADDDDLTSFTLNAYINDELIISTEGFYPTGFGPSYNTAPYAGLLIGRASVVFENDDADLNIITNGPRIDTLEIYSTTDPEPHGPAIVGDRTVKAHEQQHLRLLRMHDRRISAVAKAIPPGTGTH